MSRAPWTNIVTLKYTSLTSDAEYTYRQKYYGDKPRETYIAQAAADLSRDLRLASSHTIRFVEFSRYNESDMRGGK